MIDFRRPLFLQVGENLSYDPEGPKKIFRYYPMQAGAGSWGPILIFSQEYALSGELQEYQRFFSAQFFSFSSTLYHLYVSIPAGNA
jgi:hypothetical protein